MASTHYAAEFTQDPPAWIRPYLRIPYRDRDCWQLCDHVQFSERGVHLPLFEDDLAHTKDETLWAIRLRESVDRVVTREMTIWPRVEKPEPLDIALYRVRGTRWHVATVAGGGWAINTDLRRGSHPIRLRDSEWTHFLEGYYRYETNR